MQITVDGHTVDIDDSYATASPEAQQQALSGIREIIAAKEEGAKAANDQKAALVANPPEPAPVSTYGVSSMPEIKNTLGNGAMLVGMGGGALATGILAHKMGLMGLNALSSLSNGAQAMQTGAAAQQQTAAAATQQAQTAAGRIRFTSSPPPGPLDGMTDQFGNPIGTVDRFGNPIGTVDRFGNPMQTTAAPTAPTAPVNPSVAPSDLPRPGVSLDGEGNMIYHDTANQTIDKVVTDGNGGYVLKGNPLSTTPTYKLAVGTDMSAPTAPTAPAPAPTAPTAYPDMYANGSPAPTAPNAYPDMYANGAPATPAIPKPVIPPEMPTNGLSLGKVAQTAQEASLVAQRLAPTMAGGQIGAEGATFLSRMASAVKPMATAGGDAVSRLLGAPALAAQLALHTDAAGAPTPYNSNSEINPNAQQPWSPSTISQVNATSPAPNAPSITDSLLHAIPYAGNPLHTAGVAAQGVADAYHGIINAYQAAQQHQQAVAAVAATRPDLAGANARELHRQLLMQQQQSQQNNIATLQNQNQ